MALAAQGAVFVLAEFSGGAAQDLHFPGATLVSNHALQTERG